MLTSANLKLLQVHYHTFFLSLSFCILLGNKNCFNEFYFTFWVLRHFRAFFFWRDIPCDSALFKLFDLKIKKIFNFSSPPIYNEVFFKKNLRFKNLSIAFFCGSEILLISKIRHKSRLLFPFFSIMPSLK